MTDWTTAELLCTVIARHLRDGRIFAQGIATPLVSAAYLLAKLTHAPGSLISYTVGNSFGARAGPISLSRYEDLTLGRSLTRWSFPEVVSELLPSLPMTEWFRPAQVDPHCNFNNIAIGPWHRPVMRLPGCGGIADVTTFFDDFYLYVPRHTRRIFVPQADFISGVGMLRGESPEERRQMGILSPGPRKVVTDLCVMGLEGGRLVLESVHPGVTPVQVRENTGFDLPAPGPVPVTPPPSSGELRLLRTEIDPLGIRDLEVLPQSERRERLRQILARERAE